MKHILTLTLLLSSFLMVEAQTNGTIAPAAATPVEVLKLVETEHDFGQIPQGKPVFYVFKIVNTGTTPMKLDDVHASCGCTTPEWSPEPIPAGGTATIKVGYNAVAEGSFTKPITITYQKDHTQQLMIKGNVWKAPEGAAPPNASVQFLKKQTL